MDEAKSRPSDKWQAYFDRIQPVCPWSGSAYGRGRIDIVRSRQILPLGTFEARVYILDLSRRRLKKLCQLRDHGDDEWLWSTPDYGPNGAPEPCLIQQSRARLTDLRRKLGK